MGTIIGLVGCLVVGILMISSSRIGQTTSEQVFRLEPSSAKLIGVAGEEFTLDMYIDGAVNLGGFEARISFDSGFIKLIKFDGTPFVVLMATAGRLADCLQQEISDSAELLCNSEGVDLPGPDGKLLVATLEFSVQGTLVGNTELLITSCNATDVLGTAIGIDIICKGTSITINPPTAAFTVDVNFSDENKTPMVSIALSCDTGAVTTTPLSAGHNTDADFIVTGFTGDPTCTATQSGLPDEYNSSGTCEAALEAGGSCKITNTLKKAEFTVHKEYSDGNSTAVTITLTCVSGVISPLTAEASPGSPESPAVFNVSGYTDDPTCTATESGVPAGYNGSGAPPGTCQAALVAVGSCTITNTLKKAEFTVHKEYRDGNTTAVTITLTCVSGVISPLTAEASPGSPAVFNVSGYTDDPECAATESDVPADYSGSGCESVLLSAGSCTITNVPTSVSFTVNKDFSDDSTAEVTIALACTDNATVVVVDDTATELPAAAAEFTVSDFSFDSTTCTATETPVPADYAASGCVEIPIATGTCTITNELISAPFTVHIERIVANAPPFTSERGYNSFANTILVTITLTCSSGTVAPATALATPGTPAIFKVSDFTDGITTTCTATQEGLQAAYTVDESDCFQVLLTTGTCTITATGNKAAFMVSKVYSDDNTTAVAINVTCVGTTVKGPFDVSGSGTAGVPGPPVTFLVTGFEGDPECTATELAVPAGYTVDESSCVQVPLSVGECTITNTLIDTPTAMPGTPTATPATPTATPGTPTATPTETPLFEVSPTVVAPTAMPTATPEPTAVAPTSTPAGPMVGPETGVAGSTGDTGTDGGLWVGPFDGWFLLSVVLLALATGAVALKVALPRQDPVAQALPLRERVAGEQPRLEGRGRQLADGLLPAGESLQVRVQVVGGLHGLVDTLRALDRTPGIARAHALRLEQGDGVFEVTLSAPTAPEALERAASAALRQTLRVEPDPARRSSIRLWSRR